MARRSSRRLTWRLIVLFLVLAAGTAGIIARLAQVQLIDHDHYAARAADEHLHRAEVRATRGAVLDRNGYPLVTSVAAFDVYIDPRSWQDDETALLGAAALAPFLHQDAGTLIASVRGQERGDYLAARLVDAEAGLQIQELAPPGVRMVTTSRRFYPEGDLASSVLGFIGRDQIGLAGVEASFDEELGGVPGDVYFERDGLGNPIPFGRRLGTEPTSGADLTLTIDRYIQSLVEAKLDVELAKHGSPSGSIIVMDPMTGEVLAMASRPTFKLSRLNLQDPGAIDLYRNRAVADVYEPGSVMKTLTMAAAIDLGLVNPNTTYVDTGEAYIEGGEVIKNWDLSANGTTTMTGLLQRSLNTGAVWVSNLLGATRFYDYVDRFGFMEPTHVGLGGDSAGIVRTNREDGWYPVDLATNSFGQGISITPLQMLTAQSALVNGGLLMRPYIVKEVAGPEGRRVFEPVVVRRAVSEDTSRTLAQMMSAVVDGVTDHQGQVPGYRVGGKSGTTTFANSGDVIASFVGFAPLEDPRIIMLVKVDSPQDSPWGSVVAAPVFSDLARQILSYLDVRPDVGYVGAP